MDKCLLVPDTLLAGLCRLRSAPLRRIRVKRLFLCSLRRRHRMSRYRMVTFCSVKYVTTVNCSRRRAPRKNLIPPFRRCGLPYKNCTGITSASARFLADQLRKLVFERVGNLIRASSLSTLTSSKLSPSQSRYGY